MEDRAKFALIGLFTFAVILGAFGFVFWLHNAPGTKESARYQVIFEGSVSGLRVGGPVLFNGIRVGEVTEMRLTDNPSQVAAVLSVNKDTPVRADTKVALEYAGLTGIASVSLKGAAGSAKPLETKLNGIPTLTAESTAGDMSTAVRETLGKADAVIAENQESLRNTIKNLEVFTAALARNGDKIDRLVENSNQAVATINELATSLKTDTHELTTSLKTDTHELATNLNKSTTELAEKLDKRTAEITDGINTLTDTATKNINVVGGDLHRAIINIDRQVTDLTKNPQRFLFGSDKK